MNEARTLFEVAPFPAAEFERTRAAGNPLFVQVNVQTQKTAIVRHIFGAG